MEQLSTELAKYRGLISVGVLALLLAWETLQPFFGFFRGQGRERMVHAARNLFLSGLNLLMVALVFAGIWALAARWSQEQSFGLLHQLSLSRTGHAVAALLILDFWTYWWHWMNHRIPFFWRFHRVHHSDSKMDVTTANRFHLGEIFFSSAIRIALIALLGIKIWELALYEILLFAVVQFHHANIALPSWIDKLLRMVIPTPAMHKVHHSRIQQETDSNFSSLLSIWDRVFRTYRVRDDLENINLGLDGLDGEKDQQFSGLMSLPIRPLTSSVPDKKK